MYTILVCCIILGVRGDMNDLLLISLRNDVVVFISHYRIHIKL